jgi:hypothetical protein
VAFQTWKETKMSEHVVTEKTEKTSAAAILDNLREEYRGIERSATVGAVRLGEICASYLAETVTATDPGKRRTSRAVAIDRLADCLREVDGITEAGAARVNRLISAYHTCRLLPGALELPVSVVYLLSGLTVGQDAATVLPNGESATAILSRIVTDKLSRQSVADLINPPSPLKTAARAEKNAVRAVKTAAKAKADAATAAATAGVTPPVAVGVADLTAPTLPTLPTTDKPNIPDPESRDQAGGVTPGDSAAHAHSALGRGSLDAVDTLREGATSELVAAAWRMLGTVASVDEARWFLEGLRVSLAQSDEPSGIKVQRSAVIEEISDELPDDFEETLESVLAA